MNNEEKAKEISEHLWNESEINSDMIKGAARIAAEQMAEFKDKQFVEFVKKNRGKFATDRAMDAFLMLLNQEKYY